MAPQNPIAAQPRKVLLFSGHMIDSVNRASPRFPADKEPVAAKAIADTLDRIGVERGDLAICGGACGGDLLFAEAALARQMILAICIPFEEDKFLPESIDFAHANWRARYFAAKSQASFHVASDELGPLKANEDPFERNNLWMLQVAMSFGPEKIDFVCLWNGKGADGPGGTQHLMQEVQKRGGRTHWLDTTQLWT
jgi:hypothetical protein